MTVRSILATWDSSEFFNYPDGQLLMIFKHNDMTYSIDSSVVEDALYLPNMGSQIVEKVPLDVQLKFLLSLGYNADSSSFRAL